MIVPLVILGVTLIHNSHKAMENTVSNNLRQIAFHSTGEVIKEYAGDFQELDATATIIGLLNADIRQQKSAMVELSLKFPTFRDICSVDLNGNTLACSILGQTLAHQSQIDLLDCASKQDHCFSKVRLAPNHIPVMDIAVPIHRNGKVEGALVAEYNLNGIWDVIEQIHFGPQSYAVLIDQDGHVLADPNKKAVLKNNIIDHPLAIKELQQGLSDSRIKLGPDHQKWFFAFSPIVPLHWGLIISQPYSEALSSLRILDIQSWFLLLFGVLAAAFISFVIAKRMSYPLDQLILATHRVAKGDFSVTVPIRHRDEISRLIHSFNHMTTELKNAREVERLSIVGRSAASIAHELKNSLALVKSFIQLIPQRHKEKEFIKEATVTIVKELDSWNTMLTNIRDFAIEQKPMELTVVDINDVVNEATIMARIKMNQPVHFQVHIANKKLLALINEDKIRQVIYNLISNAFEATRIGGEITIRTFCDVDPKQGPVVGFEVINTGEGISPENLNQIFNPFFTTKSTGLGLGLAICRDIVQKHHGHLDVVNQIGEKVTFRVFLPVFVEKNLSSKNHDIR